MSRMSKNLHPLSLNDHSASLNDRSLAPNDRSLAANGEGILFCQRMRSLQKKFINKCERLCSMCRKVYLCEKRSVP